mgnify:CR=1
MPILVKNFAMTSDEYCYYITPTADGGFAVAGETWSFGAGNYDLSINIAPSTVAGG